jgi:hypothetical protein
MFCISCKQLWSWKTGKIEERGHNPHYLEWMRHRGSGANGGGGRGAMARDPLDIQCGREVDWRVTRTITDQCNNLRVTNQRLVRTLYGYTASLIHVRHNDIPNMQQTMEVQEGLQKLRVDYMRRKITENHFKKRIFQIQRDANISRRMVDLLVAVQNAGTDIVFRVSDTLRHEKCASIVENDIQSTCNEFAELKEWANRSIKDIYAENSKKVKHAFAQLNSFALTNLHGYREAYIVD